MGVKKRATPKRRGNRNEVFTNHNNRITRRRLFCKLRIKFLYGTFLLALLIFMMGFMTEDITVTLVMTLPTLAYMALFTWVNYKDDKHWG